MNNDQWYLYDDYFAPSRNNDYLIPIGDYESLLSYSISSIDNIVQTNSVIFWYE